MRQEFLKLAQKAALALCTNNDPAEYFNALSTALDSIKDNKPQWATVYEAYLFLYGAGKRPQDIHQSRIFIDMALKTYKIPVYLEQIEMLILAVTLTDYRINCEINLKRLDFFFNIPEADKLESQGIAILNAIAKYPVNNIYAYMAHKKLAAIFSEEIFSIIRNPELALYHDNCAQRYASLLPAEHYSYGSSLMT